MFHDLLYGNRQQRTLLEESVNPTSPAFEAVPIIDNVRSAQKLKSLAAMIPVLAVTIGCNSVPFTQSVGQALDVHDIAQNVYFLEFDADGKAMDPLGVARAIVDLKDKRPPKLLILAFGWQHDRDEAAQLYLQNHLKPALEYLGKNESNRELLDPKKWATICISWDSKGAGIRRFLHDIVPLPGVGDTLAVVPESLVFPLTFYAKATLADRIAAGGLKTSMKIIFEKAYGEEKKPDLYLVGHSFGARILSLFAAGAGKGFVEQIRGAVFLQPAMTWWELPGSWYFPTHVSYPIVIVQSRHDHANSFLFPIASLPANFLLPSSRQRVLTVELEKEEEAMGTGGGGPLFWTVFDTVFVLPFRIATTAIAFPFQYLSAQFSQIYDRGLNYIPDTLAQIPIVEIPVELIDKTIFNGHFRWGDRHKGAFNLGSAYESLARPNGASQAIADIKDFVETKRRECKEPIIYIDVSSEVRHGIWWGENLENRFVDFSIGWLDPVGSHSDIEKKNAIYDLVGNVLMGRVTINSKKKGQDVCSAIE